MNKPSPPTAIVAEDEATLRHELVERLAQLWPELVILGEAADGLQALQLWQAQTPDVMFLDIQMPGATGLEVARQVAAAPAAHRARAVFITAYDEHAVQAFEQGAVDYLLKPLVPARLFTAVQRLKERLHGGSTADLGAVLGRLAGPAATPRQHLRWINASSGQTLRLITVDEVQFFQSDSKYTRVALKDGEALIRKPLKELAEELDPQQFWQVHRSTLVNLNAIAGVSRDFRGRLHIRLKHGTETLLVADSHAHLFKSM